MAVPGGSPGVLHNLSLAVCFAIADLLLLLVVPRGRSTAPKDAHDRAPAHTG